MNAQENDEVAAYLTRTASQGASSKQVAATVAAALTGIDRALIPIIGKSGVAALYKRTLHLAAEKNACLAVAQEGFPAQMDAATLAAALEQQTAAEAAAAGAVLLQTFHLLLTILVGLSLAERLLRPVWSTFSSDPPAKDIRPAIYFTVLGEPPLKMLRYQQQFDFFDMEAINKSIRFINLSDDAIAGDLDRVLKRIVDEVTQHGPALVFVDSFRSVVLASETDGNPHNSLQQFVQQLGVQMTSWQATTFLIGEYFTETDANPVFTVSDGLIWLRQSVQRNSMVRKLEVMKMRGQPTLPGLHTFRIGTSGIEVVPPASVATPLLPGPKAGLLSERLAMGVPGLDEMLGGGLPRGYSLLIAGPSGSGKSILAAAFLAEGVRAGETGVIAAFEQKPNQSRSRLVADLIASGTVGLVESRPDISVDEVVYMLIREIRRVDATRVVIDSLSGFELALAPTFREDFRESLSNLVTALAAAGVTVLMTSELEDRYTDLRFSPYGTAFLTDAIIVQRYIEVDSRLRRMMAVVKARASSHSDQLREYGIDANGIQLGEMMANQEGLLGGRPTKKNASDAVRVDRPGAGH